MNPSHHQSGPTLSRRGLTLVEMLIGMAITLLMMAAVVNLFANIGAGVRVRQATIEMSSELRGVRTQLYNDLTHATCRTLPWQRPDEDQGYLEIVEGRFSDRNPSVLIKDGNTITLDTPAGIQSATSQIPSSQTIPDSTATDGSGLGDYDDILALTVRSELAPFKGRSRDPVTGLSNMVESNVAEVIWFAEEIQPDDILAGEIGELGMRKVYRRQLLVAPWVDFTPFNNDSNLDPNMSDASTIARSFQRFYEVCDVSARIERNAAGTFLWVPNTLGDLTKRENRYAHYYVPNANVANGYPHRFAFDLRDPNDSIEAGVEFSSLQPFSDSRTGEDLVLENVLAFDILVYDPGAPLFEYPINSGNIIEPFKESYQDNLHTVAVNNGNLVGFGAYVDLGWDDGHNYKHTDYLGPDNKPLAEPVFREQRRAGWNRLFPNNNRGTPVYDTWSLHYEYDGINQDDDVDFNGNPLIDEGTNGLDDNNFNGVDDVGYSYYDPNGFLNHIIGERETTPPYDAPLRGVRVKLRIYEPDTRQVREVSVTANFVPE